jgi:hypothetical protein
MLLTKNNKEFLDNEKRFYRVYFNLFFAYSAENNDYVKLDVENQI